MTQLKKYKIMEFILGKFIMLYLVMPIIGLLVGTIMLIIAKKNNVLGNKKAIFYFILSCLILVIPALLGLIDYWFMPYAYIFLIVLYLILGYYNLSVLNYVFEKWNDKPYHVEFLCVFFVMFIGATFFSLVFNLCNELQYGLWACTCLLSFIFPSLFRRTYRAYIEIPLEVYSIWSYGKEKREMTTEYFNQDKIIVVELELFKEVADTEPLNIKAKASDTIPFGIWFKVFIDDYNKKSPLNPIIYTDSENSYGWIFYVITSILGRKRYIDPNLSFLKNKIKEKNIIIAKRVQYEEYIEGVVINNKDHDTNNQDIR